MALAIRKKNNKTNGSLELNDTSIKKAPVKKTSKTIYCTNEDVIRINNILENSELSGFNDLIKTYLYEYDELLNSVGYEKLKEEMKKGYTRNRALINLLKKAK